MVKRLSHLLKRSFFVKIFCLQSIYILHKEVISVTDTKNETSKPIKYQTYKNFGHNWKALKMPPNN